MINVATCILEEYKDSCTGDTNLVTLLILHTIYMMVRSSKDVLQLIVLLLVIHPHKTITFKWSTLPISAGFDYMQNILDIMDKWFLRLDALRTLKNYIITQENGAQSFYTPTIMTIKDEDNFPISCPVGTVNVHPCLNDRTEYQQLTRVMENLQFTNLVFPFEINTKDMTIPRGERNCERSLFHDMKNTDLMDQIRALPLNRQFYIYNHTTKRVALVPPHLSGEDIAQLAIVCRVDAIGKEEQLLVQTVSAQSDEKIKKLINIQHTLQNLKTQLMKVMDSGTSIPERDYQPPQIANSQGIFEFIKETSSFIQNITLNMEYLWPTPTPGSYYQYTRNETIPSYSSFNIKETMKTLSRLLLDGIWWILVATLAILIILLLTCACTYWYMHCREKKRSHRYFSIMREQTKEMKKAENEREIEKLTEK